MLRGCTAWYMWILELTLLFRIAAGKYDLRTKRLRGAGGSYSQFSQRPVQAAAAVECGFGFQCPRTPLVIFMQVNWRTNSIQKGPSLLSTGLCSCDFASVRTRCFLFFTSLKKYFRGCSKGHFQRKRGQNALYNVAFQGEGRPLLPLTPLRYRSSHS